MASSKELFQKDKNEFSQAVTLIQSTTFARLVTFARAELMQKNPSHEQCDGANALIRTIYDLIETQGEAEENITSGLEHDLTIPDRVEQETNTTKK